MTSAHPEQKTQKMQMEQKQWGCRKPYSTALALLLSSQIGSVSIPQRLRPFLSSQIGSASIPQRLRYSYRVRGSNSIALALLLSGQIGTVSIPHRCGGSKIGCQIVALCAVLFARLYHLHSACATRV